ncbi:Disease resistance protein LAZ5 [Hondaea fermentalgiana]|uniref:Disease resistance protein LAZ5 n=1 Tax=Hondaea fermentalgiana TaxID=2315210 RepID=A0A2R5GIG6_9STRA|nr:Disease resistance protein LAZ5 [Hondaea fermentalgiana]|eukprot:GBG30686.1 Disease resistance protein LAZ5 [Hondaea fermentalgiana]
MRFASAYFKFKASTQLAKSREYWAELYDSVRLKYTPSSRSRSAHPNPDPTLAMTATTLTLALLAALLTPVAHALCLCSNATSVYFDCTPGNGGTFPSSVWKISCREDGGVFGGNETWPNFEGLDFLQEFYIDDVSVEGQLDVLGDLANLTVLWTGPSVELKNFPEGLARSSSLQNLTITSSELQSVYGKFWVVQSLVKVELNSTELECLILSWKLGPSYYEIESRFGNYPSYVEKPYERHQYDTEVLNEIYHIANTLRYFGNLDQEFSRATLCREIDASWEGACPIAAYVDVYSRSFYEHPIFQSVLLFALLLPGALFGIFILVMLLTLLCYGKTNSSSVMGDRPKQVEDIEGMVFPMDEITNTVPRVL